VRRAATAARPAGTAAGAPLFGAGRAGALAELIGETRALFHRLKLAAEQVHDQGRVSAGRRGILLGLARGGAQTVPEMARARPVSRQLVQTLVNGLLADGYVEYAPNPAHRRSHRVRLTRAGARLVASMERRERDLLRGLRVPGSQRELRAAARTLRRLRGVLESDAWREGLRRECAPRGARR
jgi:DNA-binding MarR family transcriptional regulator